jgi:flagellar hook-associated protein 1 FlgK
MASALMSLGTRAMAAAMAQLQTTSHNIANASVAGYSRQEVELATSKGQFTGAGFFGKGVDVATVQRAHDQFLTREAAVAASLAAGDKARHEQLVRLENAFPTGEQGVGYAAGQLLNAMVDLASRPQDISTREVVLARAQEVAARFSLASRQFDALQAGATQDLKNSVASVNEIAQRIADVNQQIAAMQGFGHSPNDLLDERDRLVQQLSGFVAVTTIPADDGTLGVFVAGGQRLVLGNQAQKLVVTPDAMDPSRSAIGIEEANGVRPLSAALLSAGSIGGLLRFQNEDLVAARASVGQMALAFASRVNEQLSLGLDLNGNAGAALFADLRATSGLAAATNAGSAAIDVFAHRPAQVQPEEYELRYDGASWRLTRADGSTPAGGPYTFTDAALAAGVAIDALGLTLQRSGAATAGDRFLLQPASRTAGAMQRVLADPRGIAAASPLTATASPSNGGTAGVGALTMTAPLASGDAVQITFGAVVPATPPAPDGVAYTWTRGAASGAGAWTPGQPLAIGEFTLALTGVPVAGDVFDVAPTAFPAASNGNAMALAALRDETFVGRRADGSGGESITDAYASAMAGIGVRVQSAATAAEISASVQVAADQLRESKSGVNLDEEAARLIQFQQSYQAAAKVLQVAQQIFETLLSTAAR